MLRALSILHFTHRCRGQNPQGQRHPPGAPRIQTACKPQRQRSLARVSFRTNGGFYSWLTVVIIASPFDPLPQHEESHAGPYGVEMPLDWVHIAGPTETRPEDGKDEKDHGGREGQCEDPATRNEVSLVK